MRQYESAQYWKYCYIVEVIIMKEESAPSGQSLTPAQMAVVRNIWLSYYNNVLLEKGVITADEHRRMTAKINTKYPYAKP